MTAPTPLRAATYARVSTSDQSTEAQVDSLTAYATGRGWQIVQSYQDTMSGGKATRPGLAALLAGSRASEFDVVLVTKIDRLGRSIQHFLQNMKEFAALGVRVIATTQGIDTDTSNAVGRLQMHMLAAFAEFELEIITDRIKAGVAARKARGLPVGRAKRIFDREGARRMRAEGKSYREIARALGVSSSAVVRECSEGVSVTTPSKEASSNSETLAV